MKIYTKIVYDKDDNIIEEHSYNYNGPVSQAKKFWKPTRKSSSSGKKEWKAHTWSQINKKSRSKAVNDKRKAFLNNDNNIGFVPIASGRGEGNVPYKGRSEFYGGKVSGSSTYDGAGIKPGMKGRSEFYGGKVSGSSTYDEAGIGSTTTKDYSSPYNSHYEASYNRMRSQVWEMTEPQPNILHQFASYNALFTLSALGQGEIRNPQTFFKSAPHDIIAQSGGIGAKSTSFFGPQQNYSRAGEQSAMELGKNNDIYFKNVEINSLPGLNAKRRLTSVTSITMELVEPYGLTLLDKVRGAAYQNGFLDHLDAPYLLTIEFKGFDENGKPMLDNMDATKRVIPLKIVTMDIDVNQGGTFYTMNAIPYNEFGFSNLYIYPRTSGTLTSPNLTLSDAVAELENVLNEQNKEEAKTIYGNQYPDKYQITVDEDLLDGPDQKLNYKYLSQVGMSVKNREPSKSQNPNEDREAEAKTPFIHEIIKFSPGTSVLKLLEELMKSHPEYGTKRFEKWQNKVKKGGVKGGGNPNDGTDMYFKYFKIRSSIEPQAGKFDPDRQTEVKTIKIVVEPYYISAYNIVTAGIHQSNNYKTYVAKAYNYIFTGDNIDILNLDINYKVAYYQTRLKEDAPESKRAVTTPHVEEKLMNAPTNTTIPGPITGVLNLKSEPGIAKSNKGNKTGESDSKLDQFFDAITNPKADMVYIKMDILGDPAWISQSQFIPPAPTPTSPGISTDTNRAYFTGGKKTNIWNPTLKCYNSEMAEPVIDLTFLIPEDIDDKKGIYEISTGQKAVFSGLYKVVEVGSTFDDGKFVQTLHMMRYGNQDQAVTNTSNKVITKSKGNSNRIPDRNRGSIGSPKRFLYTPLHARNTGIPDRKMGQTGKLSRSPAVFRNANPQKKSSIVTNVGSPVNRGKVYNSPR